jgi:hypothetical protein
LTNGRSVRFLQACVPSCAPLFVLTTLWACQTPSQKQAAHNAEINRRAAREIERICALHGDARAVELKKIKDESGLELYCPND